MDCKNFEIGTEMDEKALEAFSNELETISFEDENHNFKALNAAYRNAYAYCPDDFTSLRLAIQELGRTMGLNIAPDGYAQDVC